MFTRMKQQRNPQETSELARQIRAAKTVRDLPEEARFLVREIGQRRKLNPKTGMTERLFTIKFSGRGLTVFHYETLEPPSNIVDRKTP